MKSIAQCMSAVILLGGTLQRTAQANPVYRVTNVSPNPGLTNEFYLTATNTTTSINGTNIQVLVYKDDPPTGSGVPMQLPGPLVEVNVGQTIICHFKNRLTNNIEGATIHWHGIELDNDSDGTAVAQDTIFNGQTYTYRFVVPRPGLFWYHSHMTPGTTTFGGMYGPIIVHDTNETALIAANVLPPTGRTFQLVMSDISFTNGVVGKVLNGTNFSLNTLIQLCENNILGLPNANPVACVPAGMPGDVFLCNGSVPVRSGSLCVSKTNSTPVFHIGAHERVRLQLFNASISRNCYLTIRFPCTNPTGDTNLYHIGGQGGLLDHAVLDGGVQGTYDFQYAAGTVNLGSGAREDVMFYSSGTNGDVIQLVGNSLPDLWPFSGDLGTNYPVAFFVVATGGTTNVPLTAGSPLLSAIGASNEDLRLLNTNSLAPPPVPADGTQSGVIKFMIGIPSNGVNLGPTIGGYAATALDGNSGDGSWPYVPHPPSALWARAGDVLQLAIANDTGAADPANGAAHPFHLHGFSMQPVAIYTADLQTNLFNFPFNQFVDTLDILTGEALVFRIKLSDRPRLADTATGGPLTLGTDGATGGNVGRWLMHCHIFLHGTVGMISELNVIPNTATRLVGPLAGTNSVILVGSAGAGWTNTANVPWLHLLPGYTSGTNTTTVLFSFDANPGLTRVGNLNVGGETVVVTQAGTNYVQAPGPVTALASTNISGPDGIAVDSAGNVYFGDSNNGAIKKWTLADNTVTNLVSGLGAPQGLGLDNLGNVYFADFQSTAIRMWSASTHAVTTVFTNDSTRVSGLAVDGAGNVYITVPSQSIVKEWNAASATLSTLFTNGLNAPYGVAVDVAGKVYVADTYNNAVKRLDVFYFLGNPFPIWSTLVSSNFLNTPWNLAVDDGGNVCIADGNHNAIKRWSFADSSVVTLIASGLNTPTGVAVDSAGNVYVSDYRNNAIKELPYAYVDPTPQHEGAESALDALSTVLPATENLLPPFAPTASDPWLTVTGTSGGVVSFSFAANTNKLGRSGVITLLGQSITVTQAGAVYPPVVDNASMPSNGVFHLSFTNTTSGATYTVLFATNVATPLTNWSVLGPAMQIGPDLWQFTDLAASNSTRFYRIRFP
jgi:FtsP/CotA-like multicopper oxidase with cupredoxin domain/streptogramin lyase